MKPIKSTVYLPVKVEDELPEIGRATFTFNEEIDTCSFLANDGSFKEWYQHFEHKPTHWLKSQEAFVFTPEQLNEYTANVIKQALETAAENAEITNKAKFSGDYNPVVDEESITNTFEEIYRLFYVD